MADETVRTMVNGILENQKKSCCDLAKLLSEEGGNLNAQFLEYIANSVTMMAAARRNLEMMAAEIQKAKEGTPDNPEVINGTAQ